MVGYQMKALDASNKDIGLTVNEDITPKGKQQKPLKRNNGVLEQCTTCTVCGSSQVA